MGAESFIARGFGKTAEEAFQSAVADAQYEYGHGGYTGTIAEKSSFKLFTVPQDIPPRVFADLAMGEIIPEAWQKHERTIAAAVAAVEDKWGPAGCVQLAEDDFLFFGFASS